MIEFSRFTRLTFALSFFVLSGSAVVWFLFPAYRPYSAGFMLGTAASIVNGLILAVKTMKVSEFALGRLKRRQGTGTLSRFLIAGFAGFTVVKYPAIFHWAGVVVGICVVTTLSLVISFLYYLSNLRSGKG
jgi:ATP synthase protein I